MINYNSMKMRWDRHMFLQGEALCSAGEHSEPPSSLTSSTGKKNKPAWKIPIERKGNKKAPKLKHIHIKQINEFSGTTFLLLEHHQLF